MRIETKIELLIKGETVFLDTPEEKKEIQKRLREIN
jgi:hypothetical protein